MAALQRQLPQPTELRGKIQYSPLSRQQAAALVVDCLIQQPEDLADLAAAVATKAAALVVQVIRPPLPRLKEITAELATEDPHSKAVAVAAQEQ
jgi:hypothetical protein